MTNIKTDGLVNLTVGELKKILESCPDDMSVVVPTTDYDDVNKIESFNHVRTVGILSCPWETPNALCLNGCSCGLDISDQIKNRKSDITCEKVLY